MTTSIHPAKRTAFLLLALLLTGIYSCNNAATGEKKADSTVTVVDTLTKAPDSAAMILPGDTTRPATDSGRDTKTPRPPAH